MKFRVINPLVFVTEENGHQPLTVDDIFEAEESQVSGLLEAGYIAPIRSAPKIETAELPNEGAEKAVTRGKKNKE